MMTYRPSDDAVRSALINFNMGLKGLGEEEAMRDAISAAIRKDIDAILDAAIYRERKKGDMP
jgi:hypothetical protein